jgi:hypothetical protein
MELPPELSNGALGLAVQLHCGGRAIAAHGLGGDSTGRTQLAQLVVDSAADDAPSVPELRATRLRPGDQLQLDGVLDEPFWQQAASTGRFVDVSSGGLNERFPVDGWVRLAWDDEGLVLGAVVHDTELRGGFAADSVDPHLWTRDAFEVMLDPDGDGDGQDYYELQLNPQGLVFDSRFDSYNQPRGGPEGPFGHQEWTSGVERAVKLYGSLDQPGDRDEGWSIEARLQWRSFGRALRTPPKAGDEWRINFYAMQDNAGAAWSPILGQGNFHRASRFGRVRWVGSL